MTTYTAPICLDCRHFRPEERTLACAAYPDGIPEEILTSEVDHHEPYPGDHGIRFEPKEDDDDA